MRNLYKPLVANAPAERRAEKAIQQIYRFVSRRYPNLSVAAQDALVRKYLAQIRKEVGC